MYLVRTPRFLQKLFPKAVWFISTKERKLYLTFDDGPTPEVTDWVLNELARYSAKATFFVLGNNVQRETDLFQQIISEGHSVGNHSFNHLNGWETEDEVYFSDVERCQMILKSTVHSLQSTEKILTSNHKSEIRNPKSLFRPPYGRITLSQYSILNTQYSITMWDVLSGDFDHKLTGEQCFENCRKHAHPGSILVFHDSHKAYERLKICLPLVLKHFSSEGYTFAAIE
jgi:peptidoglycan/xylan/chitin deacetylase (PgdA/CDA1 family)